MLSFYYENEITFLYPGPLHMGRGNCSFLLVFLPVMARHSGMIIRMPSRGLNPMIRPSSLYFLQSVLRLLRGHGQGRACGQGCLGHHEERPCLFEVDADKRTDITRGNTASGDIRPPPFWSRRERASSGYPAISARKSTSSSSITAKKKLYKSTTLKDYLKKNGVDVG